MTADEYTAMVWGMVPHYMVHHPRLPDQCEAVAFVMGNQRFPANVIKFLAHSWSMT